MQNISVRNFNTNSPSFGAIKTPTYRTVEKVVREICRNEYQSETYFKDVRFPKKGSKNALFKGLAALKTAYATTLIDYYRRILYAQIKSRNPEEFLATFRTLLKELKHTNCGENAFLVHSKLKELGIPHRVIYAYDSDHCFVIANREKPFNTYKDKEKGNFVADAWLRRVYPSIEEAFWDYERLLKPTSEIDKSTSKIGRLIDITDSPYQYVINPNMTTKDERRNQSAISDIRAIIDILNKFVRYEARILRKGTEHVKNKEFARILDDFKYYMEEEIRRELPKNRG